MSLNLNLDLNLTGAPFLALSAVVTAAAFTSVLHLWRKLSARRWRAVLARIVVLCAAQVTVLLLAATLANDYYDFYGSWHDLFGVAARTNQTPAATDRAAAFSDHGSLSIQSISSLNLPGSTPEATGQTQKVTIQGATTGLSTQAIVYLPPQYFQPAYTRYLFPVAIISTGYPGDLTALEDRLKYPYRLLTGIKAHTDKPIVLVMTQPTPTSIGGIDTECTNVPGGPQVGTFWAQDIPAAVEQAYPRLATARSSWGLMGDSTGGDCALKVALMNSDRFAAAVSLSGEYDAPEDLTTGDLYRTPAFRDENDPMWRLRHLPPPPIAVLLATSREGESDLPNVQEFARRTQGTPLRTSTLLRNEGGHNFATWNAELAPALHWLTNTLTSPTPLPQA